MENRLELNKRPEYKLPDDVMIEYCNLNKNRYNIPNFKPDICISFTGTIGVTPIYKTKKQYWIKSNNKDLIHFINNYKWKNVSTGINSKSIPLNTFKKIILEEFYEVKYGE